jgi:hypothetical protein
VLLDLGEYSAQDIKDSYIPLSDPISSNSTSLAPALEKVFNNNSLFKNSNDPLDNQRPKILILITVGAPTDCSADYNTPIFWINKLKMTKDVLTYVIGFNAGFDELNLYAEAGGTDSGEAVGQKYFSATNPTQLISAIRKILSCQEYAFAPGDSCSADCQTFGGYCGNGKVEVGSPEECDDGNENDTTDNCHNDCTKNTVPEEITPIVTPPACGNGKVDSGEACDEGDKNGRTCIPTYGHSCT